MSSLETHDCDSLFLRVSLFTTALAKDNQDVIDLCQPAMQSRVEGTLSQSATSSFLFSLFPSSAAYFFLKFIPPPSHSLILIFLQRLFSLVLHTCINKLTTDFRRSPRSLSSSTCPSIWFSFLPLICSSVQRPRAFLPALMPFVHRTECEQGSIFTPLMPSTERAIRQWCHSRHHRWSLLFPVMRKSIDGKPISSLSRLELIDYMVFNTDTRSTYGSTHTNSAR